MAKVTVEFGGFSKSYDMNYGMVNEEEVVKTFRNAFSESNLDSDQQDISILYNVLMDAVAEIEEKIDSMESK